ncbi:galactoside alpha-(1,2)-fucosyltransferase 2-like, partial [Equus quagga]|uniref:galactoside alpha-(1,2)-fucosyltransferase 2-like n=1 Tax=Equus quagga TaxID=89248 RepID=UPI001EE2865B
MLSTQAPFFFPMGHFILFVFVASTIFHIQQRLAKIQRTGELVPAMRPALETMERTTTNQPPIPRGMWTINAIGRLGNQMGEYATLYALAKMNGRPAYIPAQMHNTLAPIFRITLPVLHGDTASRVPWRNYHLNDWMEERY